MGDPKKHHFLPQSYLERFQHLPKTTKLPRIWVYPRDDSVDAFNSAIHDTACIANYHTIDAEDREPDRKTIENRLSMIEGNQKILLDRILHENQVSSADRDELCLMVALMRTRVPSFKRQIERSLQTAVLSLAEHEIRHGRAPEMPEELRKTGKSFRELIKAEISNWKMLELMFDAASGGQFIATLARMNLVLLKSAQESHFITGDTPVSIYIPGYEKIKPYGARIEFKEAELTFPLSPRLMLLAVWRPMETLVEIDANEVDRYNRRTVIMADKYAYADMDSQRIAEMMGENRNMKAGFVVDELDTDDSSSLIGRFIPVTD